MTRTRAAAAPASPYGRRLRDSSSRCITTTASGKINTNNNRRQVGPLQVIAPGPAQAIVFRSGCGPSAPRPIGRPSPGLVLRCEVGRGSFEQVALLLQAGVLTPQAAQLL